MNYVSHMRRLPWYWTSAIQQFQDLLCKNATSPCASDDLLAGFSHVAQASHALLENCVLLEQQLASSGGVPAFTAALAAARHRPTPTLTPGLPDLPALTADEEREIRRLIDALVAGSSLAEVNALCGYA